MNKIRPTRRTIGALFAMALLAVAFCVTNVHAQTDVAPVVSNLLVAPAPENPLPPELDTFVTKLIVGVAQKYPVAAQVLGWLVAFMGFMRLWAKPLFSGLHSLVDMTPSKFDDTIFARFRTFLLSPSGAWLHFLLDYLCSIKIVPPNAKPNAVEKAIDDKKAAQESPNP